MKQTERPASEMAAETPATIIAGANDLADYLDRDVVVRPDDTLIIQPGTVVSVQARADAACCAGLETCSITGMTYNPFTRTYALAADTSVNYILCARAP